MKVNLRKFQEDQKMKSWTWQSSMIDSIVHTRQNINFFLSFNIIFLHQVMALVLSVVAWAGPQGVYNYQPQYSGNDQYSGNY